MNSITIVVPRIARRDGLYWEALRQSIETQMIEGDVLISEVDTLLRKDYGVWLRNRVIKEAVTDYIYGIDDDDELLPGALETMRARAVEHPKKILVFNTLCEYDDKKLIMGGAPIFGQGYRWLKEVYQQSPCIPLEFAKLSYYHGKDYCDQDYFAAIGGHSSRAVHFSDIVARICINRQHKERDW